MKLLLTDAERIQLVQKLLDVTSILMNLKSSTSYCAHCASRNIITYSNDDLSEMACEAHFRDELKSSAV